MNMNKLRSAYHSVRDLCASLLTLGKGVGSYLRYKKTPQNAYYSMINLFCQTRGISNDLLHQLVRLVHRPSPIASTSGQVLGDLDKSDFASAIRHLRSEGYYVFPRKLPAVVTERL